MQKESGHYFLRTIARLRGLIAHRGGDSEHYSKPQPHQLVILIPHNNALKDYEKIMDAFFTEHSPSGGTDRQIRY